VANSVTGAYLAQKVQISHDAHLLARVPIIRHQLNQDQAMHPLNEQIGSMPAAKHECLERKNQSVKP
jgi:hypothetical protein